MKIKYQGPCIKCGGVVHNFKRKLCKACYQREYRDVGPLMGLERYDMTEPPPIIQHESERRFVDNFFKHNNWIYQPCLFRVSSHVRYAPDFYDGERNVFIEVSSSVDAYKSNQAKYRLMAETYPHLLFEIRSADGDLFTPPQSKGPNWGERQRMGI